MKNKYPGRCNFCGQPVGPYEGVAAKTITGSFRIRHLGCNRAHHATKGKTNAAATVHPSEADTSGSSHTG